MDGDHRMNKPVDAPLSSAALAQWQHEYAQQIGQDLSLIHI